MGPEDYSHEKLAKALNAIIGGEKTINTLHNTLQYKAPWEQKMEPLSLSPDVEAKFSMWILDKAKLGFPMHPEEVYNTVENYMNANNISSTVRPGKRWLTLFLNRHPEVARMNAQLTSKLGEAVTEEAIQTWFFDLDQYLTENNASNVKHDPTRIFYSDAMGIMTCPKTGLSLGPKSSYESDNSKEKESITVLCNFSADGKDVPPFVVYPCKEIPRAVLQSFPSSWFIGQSDNGWMVSDTFFFYIRMFYDWLINNRIKLPILLFLDRHKSYINKDMFDFCQEKGILLFCLYPNAANIMQPYDVANSGPIKKFLTATGETMSLINKQNFAQKFKEAYDKGLRVSLIKYGFKACGLFPVDPNAVDYSRIIKSTDNF